LHVHLVGSIGLDNVDEVFRTVGSLLGPYVRRVPARSEATVRELLQIHAEICRNG
jgi:hypothetical protein